MNIDPTKKTMAAFIIGSVIAVVTVFVFLFFFTPGGKDIIRTKPSLELSTTIITYLGVGLLYGAVSLILIRYFGRNYKIVFLILLIPPVAIWFIIRDRKESSPALIFLILGIVFYGIGITTAHIKNQSDQALQPTPLDAGDKVKAQGGAAEL